MNAVASSLSSPTSLSLPPRSSGASPCASPFYVAASLPISNRKLRRDNMTMTMSGVVNGSGGWGKCEEDVGSYEGASGETRARGMLAVSGDDVVEAVERVR